MGAELGPSALTPATPTRRRSRCRHRRRRNFAPDRAKIDPPTNLGRPSCTRRDSGRSSGNTAAERGASARNASARDIDRQARPPRCSPDASDRNARCCRRIGQRRLLSSSPAGALGMRRCAGKAPGVTQPRESFRLPSAASAAVVVSFLGSDQARPSGRESAASPLPKDARYATKQWPISQRTLFGMPTKRQRRFRSVPIMRQRMLSLGNADKQRAAFITRGYVSGRGPHRSASFTPSLIVFLLQVNSRSHLRAEAIA